jgi:hypothetical protein
MFVIHSPSLSTNEALHLRVKKTTSATTAAGAHDACSIEDLLVKWILVNQQPYSIVGMLLGLM